MKVIIKISRMIRRKMDENDRNPRMQSTLQFWDVSECHCLLYLFHFFYSFPLTGLG